MSASTGMVTAQNVDLSNCDREQIQYAGAIQPHGALITASEPGLIVLQASVNCDELLGFSAEQLLGNSLETIFDALQMRAIREQLDRGTLSVPYHVFRTIERGNEFDVFAHRGGGVLIFEFEKRKGKEDETIHLYSDVRGTLANLQATLDSQAFFDLAASQIREFTGFDRVMIYKFMADGSGWVRAESLLEGQGFTPYLGLHYPASDIPEPARRLFGMSWLRHQPDIGYTPVPITPEINPASGGPLDLSLALLRSVSAMYSGYLKNMGTQSSMVMTLLKNGKLWGLIACHHHRAPLHVPYEIRMACEFMAHMVSLLMAGKEDLENSAYRLELKSLHSVLLENLARENELRVALLHRTPTLLDFVRASGVALVTNNRVDRLGETPRDDQILSLVNWISHNMTGEVFSTDSMAAQLPEAESYKDTASGVLALRVSREKNEHMMWFRPEQIRTVEWAGDPRKPVDASDDGQRLMPRTSFAIWKETVHLKSEPWLEMEIAAASDLRTAMLEVVLRKAEEMRHLYQELERSHAQLDAFAYVASHDLKEPLRGISNFARMLSEDYAEKLDEEGQQQLATLRRLSSRMDGLLDSLLEYSRVGRKEFSDEDVNINQVVADAIEALHERIDAQKTEIRIPAWLPWVRGDTIHLGEVFLNLIGNAVKYNDKDHKWVEIGMEPAGPGGQPVFYVRDNGIGIRLEHQEQIFEIFRRLHGRDEFGGGAGAGLTITKKIIERHGGRIWVESRPGEGTTFRFTAAASPSV